MAAPLEALQRHVHEQREDEEDHAERERQTEVALARVEGDGGGERAGLAPDVAAYRHGGADLGYDVAERRGDHRREREARLARHGPGAPPAPRAAGPGGAPDPPGDAPPGSGP